MARIRSVMPQMRTSRTVAAWPREVRYAWVLLWGYLDDSGRGLDDCRLIVADLFPMDRDITERKMDRWLSLMAEAGQNTDKIPALCRYEVDGVRYLHAVKFRDRAEEWKGHQRPGHPTPSRIPRCPIHESLMRESGDPPEPDPASGGVDSRASPERLVNAFKDPLRSRARGVVSSELGVVSRERPAGARTREASAAGGHEGHRSQRATTNGHQGEHPEVTGRLLAEFENTRGDPLLPNVRPRYERAVDRLLVAQVAEDDIREALRELGGRGKGPALLADLVEEIRGKRALAPVHLRDPALVTEEELTAQVVESILGPDVETAPSPPDEVLNGPAAGYQEWHRRMRDERLAKRRRQAREALAAERAREAEA